MKSHIFELPKRYKMKVVEVIFQRQSSIAIFCWVTIEKRTGFLWLKKRRETHLCRLFCHRNVYAEVPIWDKSSQYMELELYKDVANRMIIAHREFLKTCQYLP